MATANASVVMAAAVGLVGINMYYGFRRSALKTLEYCAVMGSAMGVAAAAISPGLPPTETVVGSMALCALGGQMGLALSNYSEQINDCLHTEK